MVCVGRLSNLLLMITSQNSGYRSFKSINRHDDQIQFRINPTIHIFLDHSPLTNREWT